MDTNAAQKTAPASTYWYTCKYAPIELLAGFGIKTEPLKRTPDTFSDAENVVGPRMCGFSKALVQRAMDGDISHLLVSDCCAAMQRSVDAISALGTTDTLDMLEIPHCDQECTCTRFEHELRSLMQTLSNRTGRTFDMDACRASFAHTTRPRKPYIGFIGVRAPQWLFALAQESMPLPVINLTCTGIRDVDAASIDFSDTDAFIRTYAHALLAQMPCARMEDTRDRAHLFEDPNLRAVLYHTVRFCDFYDIEFASHDAVDSIPMLHIEDDFTRQGEGQMRTRLEAFAEQLRGMGIGRNGTDALDDLHTRNVDGTNEEPRTMHMASDIHASDASDASDTGVSSVHTGAEDKMSGRRRSVSSAPDMLVAGIDSGSTSTDVVIMDADKHIVAQAILPTHGSATKSAEASLAEALRTSHLRRNQIHNVVATGYGRDAIKSKHNITEITCHAKGAHFLNPNVRCVIDIGGQDSKAISIDSAGTVTQFAMNDKCAAGTGRFLEMMAQALGISLEEMSHLGDEGGTSTTITSTCSVFAESEVVSLIAKDVPIADIVAAIDRSVAQRVGGLARRVGIKDAVMMTGGVTKNVSVVHAIERQIGHKVQTDTKAQLCGAIGAALSALV